MRSDTRVIASRINGGISYSRMRVSEVRSYSRAAQNLAYLIFSTVHALATLFPKASFFSIGLQHFGHCLGDPNVAIETDDQIHSARQRMKVGFEPYNQ